MFTIRTVNLTDSDNYLGSPQLASVAAQFNLSASCPSNDKCDFTATFSDGMVASFNLLAFLPTSSTPPTDLPPLTTITTSLF